MDKILGAKKILILVANGVEEAAMSTVQRELLKTGVTLKSVGIEPGLVNSWNNNTWGLFFPVDQQIGLTLGSDFDCLFVPSGSRAVTKLSTTPHAERIIASFIDAGKKVVFMGDAVELLAKVNLAKGFRVAGPERLQQVMTAAGAEWAGQNTTASGILMTGEATDMAIFVNDAIAHYSDAVEMKAAA